MTRYQYGISALVSETSFGGETSGSVAKCQLFSQAISSTVFSISLFIGTTETHSFGPSSNVSGYFLIRNFALQSGNF